MMPGMMGQPGMMQPGMGQPGMMGQQPGMMGMQPGMQMGMQGANMGMQMGMQGANMGMQMGMQQQFEQPTKTYADGQTVHFQRNKMIMRATYGPQGSNNDVTQRIQQLVQNGQRVVYGGIHTAIGDPNPGQPKVFKIWYAGRHGRMHVGRNHPQYQQFRAQCNDSSSSDSSSSSS